MFRQLKNLDKELKIYVTEVLEVPEVKQDKLRTAVKLDLLLMLSGRLQEMYTKVLKMAAETCKCSEDLKTEFYDFAYHGLRAEHNDLVARVIDLESFQAEMSDEEKEEFERLKQHQVNRQRQVDRLEKLWKGLSSSVRKDSLNLSFWWLDREERVLSECAPRHWKVSVLLTIYFVFGTHVGHVQEKQGHFHLGNQVRAHAAQCLSDCLNITFLHHLNFSSIKNQISILRVYRYAEDWLF